MSSSSQPKRFRPKVAADRRKRVAQACTRCRRLKRKCVPGPKDDACNVCYRNHQPCVFEVVCRDEDSIRPDDDGTKRTHGISEEACISIQEAFKSRYPEISITPDHVHTLSQLIRSQHEASHTPRSPGLLGGQPEAQLASSNDDFLADVSQTMDRVLGSAAPGQEARQRQGGYGEKIKSLRPETIALAVECLAQFPSHEEAEMLALGFFQSYSSSWFYCDPNKFRRRLDALYRDGLQHSDVSVGFICLVLSSMALGRLFGQRPGLSPFSSASASFNLHKESEPWPGTEYFVLAQRLLPPALEHCSLEAVQSSLLMSLFLMLDEDRNLQYTYLGLSLRLAVALSLHRRGQDSTDDPSFAEESNRTFWTVYCLDRRLSTRQGRPEMLQERDITTPLPQWREDLDGPDTSRVERFRAFILLTKIQNRANQTNFHGSESNNLLEIKSSLHNWERELPQHLKSFTPSTLRPNAHLQIMYHMTWMQLGRTSLLAQVKSRLQNNAEAQPGDAARLHLALSGLCARSASTVLDLVQQLRDHDQLVLYSHMDFHSCSSAVILLLLDEIVHPHDAQPSKVENALAILDYMGTGSEYARSGIKLVRHFHSLLRSSQSQPTRGDDASGSSTDVPRQVSNQPAAIVPQAADSPGTGDAATGADLAGEGEPQDFPPMINTEFDLSTSMQFEDWDSRPQDLAALNTFLFEDFDSMSSNWSGPDLCYFGFHGFTEQ